MADREKIINEAFDAAITEVWNNDDYFDIGYNNGLEEGRRIALALLKEQEAAYQIAEELLRQKTILFDELLAEQEEERRRMITWLGKFCRHIDNKDRWLPDEENLAFFRKKMKQQFGWDFD